jgi:phospholipid/cholesterol/gamma-HCH transport system ATP-binding protein
MSGSGDQFAIQVRDLVVGFRQQTVIDHLSLDVRKGEILGLVGAPGGGKSVLMRQSAVAAFNMTHSTASQPS